MQDFVHQQYFSLTFSLTYLLASLNTTYLIIDLLYYTIPYHTTLCYTTTLHYTVLQNTTQYYKIPHNTILYYTMLACLLALLIIQNPNPEALSPTPWTRSPKITRRLLYGLAQLRCAPTAPRRRNPPQTRSQPGHGVGFRGLGFRVS